MSTLEKYSKDTDRSLSVDSGLEVGDGEKATQETDVIGELKSLYMKYLLKNKIIIKNIFTLHTKLFKTNAFSNNKIECITFAKY